MHGSTSIPFSTLFADTVRTHGAAWAMAYYQRRGMPAWELAVWMRAVGALVLAATLTACGGGGSSEQDEPAPEVHAPVVATAQGLPLNGGK